VLREAGYRDPEGLLATLHRVRRSGRYAQLPALSQARFDTLLPRLLEVAARMPGASADPHAVFIRLLWLLEAVSRRSAYLALIIEHPPLLPRITELMGASQWAADYLARHPWPEFSLLYYAPYLDNFKDEYRPFDAGLNALDQLTVTDFLRKEGASPSAITFLGGKASALDAIWFHAIKNHRGMRQFETRVFRINGGNQRLTDMFASKLGDRLRLGCPVTSIEHANSGVTAHYSESGRAKKADADYLVNAMPLVALRKIPVTPDWPVGRRYIIQNLPYDSYGRAIFQSRTRFWEKDGVSPNVEFEGAALSSVSPKLWDFPLPTVAPSPAPSTKP